jgi:putative CocE/NonD family hydrolase
LACLPAIALGQRKSAPDVQIESDVTVRMRDGVQLATDVYRPARNGKPLEGRFPVILTRTPYDKSGNTSTGEYYARHGYVFVAQDTRGRYKSDGVWRWLTDDGPDGVDAARWIAEQPWSNGKIGMIGTSYFGGTQHALAMEGSPYLTTVIPVDAVCNMGYASMRNGGAFEMRFWNWIMLNSGRGSRAARDPMTAEVLKEMADNRREYLSLLPVRRGTTPLKLAPEFEDWLVEAMRHGANDAFWRQNNIIDFPQTYQDIAVYLVGGWYDSWASNTTATYRALTKQPRKSPTYLIMGPWIHGAQGSSEHGQVSFGQDAAIDDPLAWRLAWYDRWLKDDESTVGKADPFRTQVRIFVMGTGDGSKTKNGKLNHGGSWRNENEWPLARTQYQNWHLQAGGGLSREMPSRQAGMPAPHSGAGMPSPQGGSTSFVFDPKNPVPTIGGNISSGNDIMLQGGWDQRGGPHVWNWTRPIPLSARNDVLVFQSEPLAEDLEVTGELAVELWISSTATDTDFTAKLIDVYPPSADFPGGFDLNIGDGILRTRFRESLSKEKLMQPGEVSKITIRLYPTSNVFKKGHRIRVDVSSSNFPRFDVNPNSGEPLAEHRRSQVATNTVYHSEQYPSRIVLPVISKDDLVKAEKEKLVGIWNVVSVQANGTKVPPEALKGFQFIFTAESLTRKQSGKLVSGARYKLDLSKSPKWIDMTGVTDGKEQSVPALYELDGDNLSVCFPADYKNKEGKLVKALKRPEKLEGGEGSGQVFMILKRAKDARP